MAAVQQKQQGYHHLETDDEVLKRLKDERMLSRMRARDVSETFDQWLEVHGLTRKMIYIP